MVTLKNVDSWNSQDSYFGDHLALWYKAHYVFAEENICTKMATIATCMGYDGYDLNKRS